MDLQARFVQVGEEKVGICLRCFLPVLGYDFWPWVCFLSLSLLLGGLSFLPIVLTDERLAIYDFVSITAGCRLAVLEVLYHKAQCLLGNIFIHLPTET